MCWKRVSTILVIGGCTAIREEGALKSIEAIEVRFGDGDQPQLKRIHDPKLSRNLLVPRRAPTAILTSASRLAVIGGCSAPKAHLNSIEILDLSEKGTSEENKIIPTELPKHSCAASCSVEPDAVMIIGGFDGYDSLKTLSIVRIKEKVESITRLPDFVSSLKNAVAVKSNDQEVLVIGGWDGSRTLQTIFRLKFGESFTSYEWDVSALMPHPIEGHSVSRWKDFLLVTGGFDGIAVTDRITKFDLKSNSAEVLSIRLKKARENHTSQIIGKFLFVIGGWDGSMALDSIEVFELLDEEPFLREISADFRLQEARNRPTSLLYP